MIGKLIQKALCLVTLIATAVAFAAIPTKLKIEPPSEELGTMPDKAYVIDYWNPPVDAIPSCPIQNYTLNTRVPEYRWLKYDGAYALALNLTRIEKEKIEKEIQVGLILTNRNKNALSFNLAAEKNPSNRQVGIYNLDLNADEFCGVAMKVRTKVKNADPNFQFMLLGEQQFHLRLDSTSKPSETFTVEKAKDGFVSYVRKFTAKPGMKINKMVFTLGAATAEDFEQLYEIIDFRLLRPAPKARFTDLPARRWTKKENVYGTDEPLAKSKCIDDVFAYIRKEASADSTMALPNTYELRPQLEKEKDGGFKVEYVKVDVLGKQCDAVRITLEKGPRCLLRFPFAFDGLENNVFSFLGKVEVFEGAKPCLGDVKPMLWGANQIELNRPFDTFQISFFSKTDDFCDWTRWGLAQADYCQNKDVNSVASKNKDGWRAFVYDIANSDPSNNKSSFYTKLTHWCFYYNNKKIPEGKKVVITIADPRVTKGLMLAGGDLKKYKEFLKKNDSKRIVDFSALDSALDVPQKGRLKKPIKFIKNRRAVGAIYLMPNSYAKRPSPESIAAYSKIVSNAAEEFAKVLHRKYSMFNDVPILRRRIIGKNDKLVNSIIVGGDLYSKIDKKTYDADMKALKGKPGCAIRSDGTNIYIYASNDYNYAGDVRGLAFGLYELLENNTDLIYSYEYRTTRRDPMLVQRNFEPATSPDFDLVWGDGFVHAPKIPEYNLLGAGGVNRVPGYNWVGDWEFARHRTRTLNHWWGYGTEAQGNEVKGQPNDTWGRRVDGSLMRPGCYTGHPCLIRVLDRACDSYLYSSSFKSLERTVFAETQAPGKAYAWNSYDVHGLWVEDSISMCQCSECLTPIRLADGTTVGPDSPYFRSTQYYANGSAMINAVNVYGNRSSRIESIGYFWMAPVPLINVSRNYDIRFCPYIRKNYFVPIYAPMNDMHWRAMIGWSQQEVRLSLYEYFLCIGARPWADVAAYDFNAEYDIGFYDWHAEATQAEIARMEKWVMARMLWGSNGEDVPKLRAYYLKRTYREAAEPIARFFELVMRAAKERLTFASPMEFEDNEIIFRNTMRIKSGIFGKTVFEQLEDCVVDAEKAAESSVAKNEVALFRAMWNKMRAAAEKAEEAWRKDVEGGADSKPMKIVGAPD